MLKAIPTGSRNSGGEVQITGFPNIRTHDRSTTKETFRKSIHTMACQTSKGDGTTCKKMQFHVDANKSSSAFEGSNSTLDTVVSAGSLLDDSFGTLEINVTEDDATAWSMAAENRLDLFHDSLTLSRKSTGCTWDDTSSVPDSVTTTTTAIQSKTVRFCLSKNEYIPASKNVLTPQEIHLSWWTKEDFHRRVRRTKSFIADFPIENKEPMQDLIQLVALCYKAQGEQLDDYRKAILFTPTVSRGLESEIITPLRESRKRHMEAVLEITMEVPSVDIDAIARRSRALSRPHQILAHVYAQRDAAAAGIGLTKTWLTTR
jgi:hypothetical protein